MFQPFSRQQGDGRVDRRAPIVVGGGWRRRRPGGRAGVAGQSADVGRGPHAAVPPRPRTAVPPAVGRAAAVAPAEPLSSARLPTITPPGVTRGVCGMISTTPYSTVSWRRDALRQRRAGEQQAPAIDDPGIAESRPACSGTNRQRSARSSCVVTRNACTTS